MHQFLLRPEALLRAQHLNESLRHRREHLKAFRLIIPCGQVTLQRRDSETPGALAPQFDHLAEMQGGLGALSSLEHSSASNIFDLKPQFRVRPQPGLQRARLGRADVPGKGA